MTVNSVKFNDNHSKKTLFNSSFVYQNKLNKSRSLLKKSVLSCNLKANNIELAKNLAANEVELAELRRENTRLLRENYDLAHTGQFRAFNCENFMTKFYELTDIAMTLFNEVCKLSDSLLQLQNHPFVLGENTSDITINQQSIIPSPFESRDKILRSPLQQSVCKNIIVQPSITAELLASQVGKVKDQLSHSIHNLSINPETYLSILNKSMNQKTDNIKTDNNVPLTHNSDKAALNKSFLPADFHTNRKLLQTSIDENETIETKKLIFRTKKRVPKCSPDKKKTKKSTKKPNKLKLKEEPNKEEHRKRVEKDAFYLSQNETINCTIVAPTYNEFKKSQPNTKSDDKENIAQIQTSIGEDKVQENQIKNIPDESKPFYRIIDPKKSNVAQNNLEEAKCKPAKKTNKLKTPKISKKAAKISNISPNKQEVKIDSNVEGLGKRKRSAVNYKLSPVKKRKKKST